MALQAQSAQDSDSGSCLADLRGSPKYEIQRRVAIRSPGVRHAELPNVQRLAAVPAYYPKIAHSPKVRHFQWRGADQFTNHPGIRKHPIGVTWNKAAIRNAANSPSPRLTVPRRRKKGIAWSDCHHSAGR